MNLRGERVTPCGQERTMPLTSKITTKVLLIVGLAFLAVGLIPGRSQYTDEETGGRVTEWRLGLRVTTPGISPAGNGHWIRVQRRCPAPRLVVDTSVDRNGVPRIETSFRGSDRTAGYGACL